MKRRGFLQGLTLAALGSTFHNTASAAPVGTMKEIQTMQNNWRTLLAADFKAPAPTEALKLANTEWRKRLDKAVQRAARRGHRTRRHQPAERRKTPRRICLRRL